MTETSTCFSLLCGQTVDGTVERCPKCGSRMRTAKTIRIFGWVLLVIGIFLIGMMGTITWYMLPTMLRPGQEVDGSTFTGTPDDVRMIISIFGLVTAFGIGSAANGLWQISTGRRSRLITIATLVLAGVLYLTARYMMDTIK